jgi:hypothetical protein
VGAAELEERESKAGEMSSHAVEKIDRLLLLANLDNADPRGAAIFWSKALSRLAQLGLRGQPEEEFLPWTADRVLDIIEDDGHGNNLLTRPEIILFFKSIKTAGYSDEDILSMWETIVHSQPPTSRAWDAPHAHSFTDLESMIVNRSTAWRSTSPDARVALIMSVES